MTTKNLCYITINRVIPLYRIINQINGNIEEINGNKHLIPIPTDESKDTLRRYEELWKKNQRSY